MKKGNKTSKKLDEKVADLEEKWKRARADYLNLERRIEKEKGRFVKFSNAVLLDKLLPVLDNLERAQKHLKDRGLALALEQMGQVLLAEGVEEIKAKGRKFDPEAMDCLEIVKGKKDIVVAVIDKGYTLNGRVLRPAKVKVGKGEK